MYSVYIYNLAGQPVFFGYNIETYFDAFQFAIDELSIEYDLWTAIIKYDGKVLSSINVEFADRIRR